MYCITLHKTLVGFRSVQDQDMTFFKKESKGEFLAESFSPVNYLYMLA